MTRLFVLTLLLTALGAGWETWALQGSTEGSLKTEAQIDATDQAHLLRQIVDEVQWPLEAEKNLVLLSRPHDVGRQGLRLILGPWLWHRKWEFPLPMQLPQRIQSPFRSASLDEQGRGHLDLEQGPGKQALRFEFRLLRRDSSVPLWQGQPAPGPCLILHLDTLERILPDAIRRRRFVADVLLPAFRRTSAVLAADPGPGQRGRDALATPDRKQRSSRRAFHSRDIEGLPLLGFLKETEKGLLEPSKLQASRFPSTGLDAERAIHHSLLSSLLSDLRWPLPDPPDGRSARRLHSDDTWNRGGLEGHAALDLGSLARLDDHSRVWAAGTPVAAPAVGVHPYSALKRGDGRAWLYETRRGRYRLRLLLALYHIAPEKTRPDQAQLVAGGFERSDPWAVMEGWPKGPHTHFEVLGLYPGQPKREAFFVQDSLGPALLTAPSAFMKPHEPLILPKPEPDRMCRDLAALALCLPSLSGLQDCKVMTKVHVYRVGLQLKLTRRITLSKAWRLDSGPRQQTRASWPIRPSGQELGVFLLEAKIARDRSINSGWKSADLRFVGPTGLFFLKGLQVPVRQKLLSELLPSLLLRGSWQPAK